MLRLLPLPPKTMLLIGTTPGFEDAAARPRIAAGVSASPITKGTVAVAVSSLVVWLGIAEITGGVLGGGVVGVTVNWKVVLRVIEPSLTEIVILAEPLRPAAGVSMAVRLAPLPPKAM